jgi:ferric-chelate reductase (NADPH)
MSTPVSSSPTLAIPARTVPGVIGQVVLKLLTQSAAVASVHVLTPRFRLLSLRCDAFRSLVHVPGDKLQVRVAGMSFRTFTPFRRADDDALELLGHLHGNAPGADWLAAVAPGDRCHLRGPRRSMDLAAIERSTVFFGDETSFGLAMALCTTQLGGLDTHFIFEVTDAAEARVVLDALGRGMLRHAWLVESRPDDAHLADVEMALTRYAVADSYRHYVVSGKSTSIQQLSRSLRMAGAKPSQMLVKAYWAPGKVGLD